MGWFMFFLLPLFTVRLGRDRRFQRYWNLFFRTRAPWCRPVLAIALVCLVSFLVLWIGPMGPAGALVVLFSSHARNGFSTPGMGWIGGFFTWALTMVLVVAGIAIMLKALFKAIK